MVPHPTLIKPSLCESSLLSDQTKQARLHSHTCLAIKAAARSLSSLHSLLSALLKSSPRPISQPPICCSFITSPPHHRKEHSRLTEPRRFLNRTSSPIISPFFHSSIFN
ncbi:hypothetical protein CesoFtcFv8_007063 [Champsocephalus esox]|uniref:Uncharacterized protein n=1 Tax=Champsocephalus esox TaxID=159716 RepID=A0AAN8H448_9TELE|nr:hypothetical protein CesoFtcFv8_007063 [Champsocephalus esox]